MIITLKAAGQTDSSIQNQISTSQNANFWISGRGLIGASSDLYPDYNLQVYGKTWLDNFVHCDFGSEFVKRGMLIDGNTMYGNIPLHINGNADGIGLEVEDGLLKFIRSSDLYENEYYGGGSSDVIFRYPYGAVPFIQRQGHDYTILAIQSPPASLNAYESTLALITGDNSEEYMDLYNLSYPTSKKFGIRMQKRDTGVYKPFFFEYSDGNTTYPVLQITPDTSTFFYGKVGIGTTNPQSLLSVNGTITGKQVTVLSTGWSDFVFNHDYPLHPLAAVETYIHQNNHLPDIPSAKQIESKGLNLGDMEQKQMQKIEELTLYIIAEDKKVTAQQEQINAQNKQLLIQQQTAHEQQEEIDNLKTQLNGLLKDKAEKH